METTLRGEWREFERAAVPGNAGAEQRRQTYNAFVAGAICACHLFIEGDPAAVKAEALELADEIIMQDPSRRTRP